MVDSSIRTDAGIRTVTVRHGDSHYEVLVGPGVRRRLASVLPDTVGRVAIVTQERLDISIDPVVPSRRFNIAPGETAKSLETVGGLASAFAHWGLRPSDAIVAVGGGVVIDTAGFVAASMYGGMAIVHIPTTLLSQVDAAVGGRAAVNLPEGKNLLSVTHNPVAVLCDTDLLATLPERELRSGMGEIAKYHFLGDAKFDHADELELPERIARCIELKASLIGDPQRRLLLNYGHTLAHALESAYEYDLRHGEAVAIGLAFAARLAFRLSRIDIERVHMHDEVLLSYKLPIELPSDAVAERLLSFMDRDRKAHVGLTFILDGPDGLQVVSGIERHIVELALNDMPTSPGHSSDHTLL